MTDLVMKLDQAITQAARQYFRLVVLAGFPGAGKTATLQSIAQIHGCQLLNINLELSRMMLELTRTQRSRQVGSLLQKAIGAAPGNLVLLDNLEILFDTELEVEPLRLLQTSSRNRTVVASWNGSYRDGTLTYAEPGHPEFVQFKQPEALVVAIGDAREFKESISS